MKTKYPCISLVPELVLATMKGEKTQTRRKIQTALEWDSCQTGVNVHGQTYAALHNSSYGSESIEFPQYQPGQILWIRESAKVTAAGNQPGLGMCVQLQYVADGRKLDWIIWPERLTASPFLGKCIPNGIFKEAARTFVKITDVRVERLQDISGRDTIREGVKSEWCNDQGETPGRYLYFTSVTRKGYGHSTPQEAFQELWQSIYGIESWDSNPYVWRYEFELTERPHDFLTSK